MLPIPGSAVFVDRIAPAQVVFVALPVRDIAFRAAEGGDRIAHPAGRGIARAICLRSPGRRLPRRSLALPARFLGGLLLAIVLLSVTWIIPALTTGDVEEEGTVSGQISSMEDHGDDTDSIVTDLGDDEVATPEDQTTTEDGLEVVEN